MKENIVYIVDLPKVRFKRIEDIVVPRVKLSKSARGAVSHLLANNVIDGLNRKYRNIAVGEAMSKLDKKFGGAEKYAYEIEKNFEDEKDELIPESNPRYKEIMQIFLAQEIADKLGGYPSNFMKRALQYIYIYENS